MDLGVLRLVLADLGQLFGEVVERPVRAVKVGVFQSQEGGVIEVAFLVDDLLEQEPVVPVELAYGAAGDVAFGSANRSSILSGFPSFAIASVSDVASQFNDKGGPLRGPGPELPWPI